MATIENGGSILAAQYRSNWTFTLLTQEEVELSIMQSLIRMNMRETLEPKLGMTLYSFTEYEKEVRAAIKVTNPEELGLPKRSLLIVAFDKTKREEQHDAYSIMIKKILPFLESLNQRQNNNDDVAPESKKDSRTCYTL